MNRQGTIFVIGSIAVLIIALGWWAGRGIGLW
jgi:hypothetical protein